MPNGQADCMAHRRWPGQEEVGNRIFTWIFCILFCFNFCRCCRICFFNAYS